MKRELGDEGLHFPVRHEKSLSVNIINVSASNLNSVVFHVKLNAALMIEVTDIVSHAWILSNNLCTASLDGEYYCALAFFVSRSAQFGLRFCEP
jgi:hypothetical protein